MNPIKRAKNQLFGSMYIKQLVISCALPFAVTLPAAAQLNHAWSDPQLEAEYLAVKTTGELRPSDSFASEIKGDLAAIRAAFPEVEVYRAFERWWPGAMWLQLTPGAFLEYQNGSFRGFDTLFDSLGTPQINHSFFNTEIRYLGLAFGRVYHSERLAELFREVEGVEYADAEWSVGSGGDIIIRPDRVYTIVHGYGDCPAGCLHFTSWTFKVSANEVSLVGRSGNIFSQPFFPLTPDVPEPSFAGHTILLIAVWFGVRARVPRHARTAPLAATQGLAVRRKRC